LDKSRIKTYIIWLLVLLNLVFAGLYAYDLMNAAAAERAKITNIYSAFEKSGVTLTAEIPTNTRFKSGSVTYSRDAELAFVESLLGDTMVDDKGGGIISYTGTNGTAIFITGGIFEFNVNADPRYDSLSHSQQAERLAKSLGLSVKKLSEEGDIIGYAITRDDLRVFNQSVSFDFKADGTIKIAGFYSIGAEQTTIGSVEFDSVSVAINFLHKIETDGVLCSEVTSIEAGYIFSDSEYKPAWRINTDAGEFITE